MGSPQWSPPAGHGALRCPQAAGHRCQGHQPGCGSARSGESSSHPPWAAGAGPTDPSGPQPVDLNSTIVATHRQARRHGVQDDGRARHIALPHDLMSRGAQSPGHLPSRREHRLDVARRLTPAVQPAAV